MRWTYIHTAAISLILIHTCLFSPAIAGTKPSSSTTEEQHTAVADTNYEEQEEKKIEPSQAENQVETQKMQRVRNMHPELQIASPQ